MYANTVILSLLSLLAAIGTCSFAPTPPPGEHLRPMGVFVIAPLLLFIAMGIFQVAKRNRQHKQLGSIIENPMLSNYPRQTCYQIPLGPFDISTKWALLPFAILFGWLTYSMAPDTLKIVILPFATLTILFAVLSFRQQQ